RPTSGVVIFAKTDKALGRIGKLFKEKEIRKVYWAVVDAVPPEEEGTLLHFLVRDRTKNKSFAHNKEKTGSKRAELFYRLMCQLLTTRLNIMGSSSSAARAGS
ncbi:MAG: pseudouridine synthase, partial [Bacillota bacterium]